VIIYKCGQILDDAQITTKSGTINNLFVEIEKDTFQRIPLQNQAEIYGVIQYSLAQHGIVTNVVSNTMSPLFNFQTIIPNNITEELDQYLRTSKVFKVLILDYNMFPR
jgi:cytosine/uracil/thiamine/allantoin permease